MSSGAASHRSPCVQSSSRSRRPAPNSAPRASAPTIHTTGDAPACSTESRSLRGISASRGGTGIGRFHPATWRTEVIAITGPFAGQSAEMRRRSPLRLAISSTSIAAAVRSALGNSPGRTTTVARRRSMRPAGLVCASASAARNDAEPASPPAFKKFRRFIGDATALPRPAPPARLAFVLHLAPLRKKFAGCGFPRCQPPKLPVRFGRSLPRG